jgi:hypothetical protein
MASSTSQSFKYLLKFVVPYNLVVLWQQRIQRSNKAENWEIRKKELFSAGWLKELQQDSSTAYSYKEANNYLAGLGYPLELNPDGSFAGALPESSLNFCASFIIKNFTGKPTIGLHVGNFVGVSLAYLTNVVQKIHPESLIVSIDPNIQHRNIKNPLNIVVGLLNKFGLQNNSLILTGYSLEADTYYEVNPKENFENNLTTSFFDRGLSCAQQLKGLEMIALASFDFFLIDGNHEANYLEREIKRADKLLKPGGFLILDDIYSFWTELQKIYESIDETKYQKLGTDGRIGVLKKLF